MAVKKTSTSEKASADKPANGLVHIQADERLVMRLKIITAARNAKMYEVVNEALTQWLHGQSQELSEIGDLFSQFLPEARAAKKKVSARAKS